MALSVSPTLPVISAQSVSSATSGAVLLPGTVVNAAVVQAAENLVQLAIANLEMNVLTEVPLTAGQSLQLAVTQNPDGGVRLTIVGQPQGQGTGASAGAGATGGATEYAGSTAATQVSASSIILPTANPFEDPLTPMQRMAVSVASETAVTQQQSLSPLFANLTAAVASNTLPPALQEAVTQVLAQQTSLEPDLTGSDVQAAFQKSGLFLEASLATSSTPAATGGVPDLKAALVVLRQALASVVETTERPATTASTPSSTQAGPTRYTANPTASPPLAPEHDSASLSPQFALGQDPSTASPQRLLSEALMGLEPGAATTATVLNLVQEALQEPARATGNATTTIILPDGRSEDVTLRTLTPPPPIRGALPAAQPVASATIPHGAPLSTVAHRLLEDTDAALARQTLLQVASLPEGADTRNPSRIDPNVPRWNFEIPFATQQGTAMAQFEISRDGGGTEIEAAKRAWRARFTLDIEPAGPVHAIVTFTGERTSVRMWAERPQTASRLRAGAFELSQALTAAELIPGDIVIREGTPPQPAPAKAGYFLDRAL